MQVIEDFVSWSRLDKLNSLTPPRPRNLFLTSGECAYASHQLREARADRGTPVRLDRLLRQAGKVTGAKLDSIVSMADNVNVSHPSAHRALLPEKQSY